MMCNLTSKAAYLAVPDDAPELAALATVGDPAVLDRHRRQGDPERVRDPEGRRRRPSCRGPPASPTTRRPGRTASTPCPRPSSRPTSAATSRTRSASASRDRPQTAVAPSARGTPRILRTHRDMPVDRACRPGTPAEHADSAREVPAGREPRNPRVPAVAGWSRACCPGAGAPWRAHPKGLHVSLESNHRDLVPRLTARHCPGRRARLRRAGSRPRPPRGRDRHRRVGDQESRWAPRSWCPRAWPP